MNCTVKEGLPKKVSESIRPFKGKVYQRDGAVKCNGLEVEAFVVCLRNNEVSMARMEMSRRGAVEVEEVAGARSCRVS